MRAGNFLANIVRGDCAWDLDEDSVESIDLLIPTDMMGNSQWQLNVRNGSATVDLTVHVGFMVKCFPQAATPKGSITVTPDAGADTFTCVAHGLLIGDGVVFSGTGGGVVAGTTYYVITTADADTFQISADRGGSAFDVANATENTCAIAAEFMELTSFAVERFAGATSTAPVGGLYGVVLTGLAPNQTVRLYLAKSAPTAAAFRAYAELRSC
jgi:hypothetical protein